MTTTTHIVKLHSAEDVVGSIPAIVGFHPSESMVVMCLRGDRMRQDLTLRYDLPPAEHEDTLSEDVAERAAAREPNGVIIACFTEEPDAGGVLPRQHLVDELLHALGRHGIGHLPPLLVRGGRWWSYDRPHENPVGGTPLPDGLSGPAAEVQALTALAGRTVHASREQIEESVKGPVGMREIALDKIFRKAVDTVGAELEQSGRGVVRSRTLDLIDTLLTRFAAGRGDLGDEEACRAMVGFVDVIARDAVIAWGCDDDDRRALLALLTALAQRALDDDAAPVCTMLAAVAFLDGNGALGNVAVERALRSDPGYSLALLIEAALQSPVEPNRFREIYRHTMTDHPRPSRAGDTMAASQ